MRPRGWSKQGEPHTGFNVAAAKRLLSWLKPYRWTICINITLTFILTGIGLLVPKFLKWTIDGVVQAAAETGAVRDAAWSKLFVTLMGFGALFVFGAFIRHAEIRRVVMFSQRFMLHMKKMFFEHLHKLSLRYYDNMKAGQIIARGTSDIDTLEHTVSWAPNQISGSILTLIGVIVFLVLEDWVLFLAVFPFLPLLVILTRWFSSKATTTWHEFRQQSGQLTANIAESISGARVIQAFAREEKNEEIFHNLAKGMYETRVETDRIQGRYTTGIRLLQMAATAVVILFGSYRILTTAHTSSPVTAGAIVAFLAYVRMFFGPIEMLSRLYNNFLHTLAAAARIIEVLDTEPEIVDRPDAVSPEDFDGEIEFNDVTFEYIPQKRVLKNVSFRARRGEIVALVGPTGGGKTTICRLIARFYETQHGEVKIDGRDIKTITQLSLHKRMGIVLQENFLFSGSVMDNIRYGRPSATDEEIIQCTEDIGSHRAISVLSNGYQTEVGERGESLSAGQRQLVCFSRAMLANPRILILDEATSSVDTETELDIQKALRRLTEQRTCFIVAHRLSTVRQADRILVVENGRITEEGTHADLLARDGRYARMYMEFIRAE